jgi:centromere protein I
VTLEGIDNAEDFVEKLDRIEPPGQLISFLTDPLLQKYVELKPSPIISSRIDLWLATCLEEQYGAERQGTGNEPFLSELLDGLLKHARYTKVCENASLCDTASNRLQSLRPIVLTFLRYYLQTWNGQDNIDAILGLLSYLPIEPFADLYSTYLSAAELVLAARGISSSGKLIELYTSLLQTRISLISQESSRRRQTTSTSPERQTLRDLAGHVSSLSTSLLLSLPSDSGQVVTSSILSFYELLSASSKPHVIPIILPPMHLVYHMAQSTSTVLSRISGIIGNYKVAFDEHPKPVKDYYSADVTETLNWCLRDIYNLLWVSRGLIITERKAAGLYCKSSLRSALNDYLTTTDREYAIGNAFGLSNNAWLASMSATAWHTLEEQEIQKEGYDRSSIRWHKGPVTQRSLAVLRNRGVSVDWDGPHGYKAYVLNWLAERGLDGIGNLMFATVTDLKSTQAKPR